MKKILPPMLAMLAMLAVLILPTYWLIQHPEYLVVPTPVSISEVVEGEITMPTPDAGNAGTLPTPMQALSTPGDAGTFIRITADAVNLRTDAGNASGLYLHRGDGIRVVWKGNWGMILHPDHLQGLKVWRGCTSDAGNLGCEAK